MIVCLTIGLVVIALLLSIDVPVALTILLAVSLILVLRVITLTAITLLLILVIAAVRLLARLESICTWLERAGTRAKRRCVCRVIVEVHLLRLTRQVVILSGRVVFPRIKIRHDDGSVYEKLIVAGLSEGVFLSL